MKSWLSSTTGLDLVTAMTYMTPLWLSFFINKMGTILTTSQDCGLHSSPFYRCLHTVGAYSIAVIIRDAFIHSSGRFTDHSLHYSIVYSPRYGTELEGGVTKFRFQGLFSSFFSFQGVKIFPGAFIC